MIYVSLAALCLALGLLGAVLPGLPTTPFLLVMCFLLLRSSPWLHSQVLRLPVVGRHVRDWNERRGVWRGVKVIATTWVIIAVALVMVLMNLAVPLQLLIAALALVGLTVVWRLPTIKE